MPGLSSFVQSVPILSSLYKLVTKTKIMKRLASGAFWMLIGKASWRLLSVIATISIARIFGPQGFGEYNIVRSTVDMFSTYAGMRLGVTSTKYVAEYRNSDPEKASRILRLTLFASFIICTVAAVLLFAGSGYIADKLLHRPDMEQALALGSLLLFFVIYGNVKQRAIAGFENFKVLARISIIHGIATPIVVIPMGYFWGVVGAIAGLVMVASLVFVISSRSLRRETQAANFNHKIPLGEVRGEASILWKFALPGVLVGMLIAFMFWYGRLILTQQDAGFLQLGLFGAAYMWRAIIVFLPAVLGHVVLPVLSETHGRDSGKEFESAVSVQVQGTLLVTLPLIVMVIGFAGPLSQIFGSEYEGVEPIIPILMLSVFFYVINHSVRQVYDSTGRRWTNFVMHLAWAATYLWGCLNLIPVMGATGLAVTHLMAEVVMLVIQSVYIDVFVVPSLLRRHGGLFILSLLLLGSCYMVYGLASGVWWFIFMAVFLLLSLVPVTRKFLRMRS